MPTPTQIVNELFATKLNNEKDQVNKFALEYAKHTVSSINLEVKDLKVEFHRTVDLVTFQVSGTVNGEDKKIERTWTVLELVTSTKPMTHIIDDVIKDVFVPSEGAQLS